MNWGEIYRTAERVSERGHKPGFYVVVSREFIAGHDDVSIVQIPLVEVAGGGGMNLQSWDAFAHCFVDPGRHEISPRLSR